MNHSIHSTNPLYVCKSLWRYRYLIAQMTRREVVGRYRGSVLGLCWSFFNPVLMLAIYTFVFSVVFKARWGSGSESKIEFALILFAGLVVFNFFAECINQAPSLILKNSNYVKKVVFPLEILPLVAIGGAIFHGAVSFGVLLAVNMFVTASLHWTVIFVPLILFPLLLMILGISWILASLGVFLRDVSQVIGLLTSVLMFLSPIFYPIAALPEKFRIFIYMNPLSFVIEQMRDVVIYGKEPSYVGLSVLTAFGLLVALLGVFWFQGTRRGFADVL